MTTPTITPKDARACLWQDSDLWFSPKPEDQELAKALCRGCPLVGPCLDGALLRQEAHGVWGATTPDERAAYRATADPSPITRIGLARRLRALAALGWGTATLARYAREVLTFRDAHAATLERVLGDVRRERPPASKYVDAEAVVLALYSALSGTHCEWALSNAVALAENAAARAGWAPPSAWDGVNIDDAAAVPTSGWVTPRPPKPRPSDHKRSRTCRRGHPRVTKGPCKECVRIRTGSTERIPDKCRRGHDRPVGGRCPTCTQASRDKYAARKREETP